ncbi:MAG: SurA N-terminal domain-containing protein [Lachnospiraceae bacterium]|nr:SurA N-terminal domain-containing protein [Lachnospiraceae bacterium]MBP3352907.1 SurA N-terminal domain-containing protein [Lachnospiraceae bacterium]
MSKQDINTVPEEQAEEKKVETSYDKKLERRKKEEAKKKKAKAKKIIIAVVVIILLAAFIASFPIRKALELKEPYIRVNGEDITKVEFDYYRAIEKANFLSQNSTYFQMFGLDISVIEEQTYDDYLTFAEYFDQLATEQIVRTKALRDKAVEEGFIYDTIPEYEQSIANIQEMAKEQDISYKEYFKLIYGPLATEERLEEIMKENLYTMAYSMQVEKDLEPSEDAIRAYYEENKGQYDSVDYHLINFSADLPSTTTDAEGNEVAYQPTEEETKAAMEEAKKLADEAEATVAQKGEAHVNESMQTSYFHENLYNFLFDNSRKPGDTCVVENTPYNGYLVASFDKRYLDETPTESARVIITSSTDAQTILDEWKAGAATEESFIEILAKYDEAGSIINDGLYGGISNNMVNEDIYAWLSAPERKAGDTTAMNIEGEANYVLYYVGKTQPRWMSLISNTLLAEEMAVYMEELVAPYAIENLEGRLKYLTVEEAKQMFQ